MTAIHSTLSSSMYVGRFAPSPTGPLHFGSLIAALGSCLEARRQKGRWIVRMEDVDAPRTISGAADIILRQLEAFGFEWDGPVLYQSTRLNRYREVLEDLIARGYAYPCACTRAEMADAPFARDGSRRYAGTCRDGLPSGREPRAWRLRTEPGDISFVDAIQGACHEDVFADTGDFVLLRADGQFAYQLAVVVDDAAQGVTHVVRGADLLDSTARQIYLQRLLGYPALHYAHLPVAVNKQNEKLSKQTKADALDVRLPAPALRAALSFLGQRPPVDLVTASLREIWDWASEHWDIAHVTRLRTIQL